MFATRAIVAVLQVLVVGVFAADVFDFLKQGDSLLHEGDAAGAVQSYTHAIDADPKSKIAFTKRAAASAAIGHLQAAIRDYTQALDLEPTSLATRLGRAQLSLRICSFDDAEKDFNAVLEAKPGHDGAQQGLEKTTVGRGHLQTAEVLVDGGDYQSADDALSRLNKVSGDCTKGRLLAAKMYLKEGNYEKCSWEAGRLLKIAPSNVQALLMRGVAFYHVEEFEMAKRHFGEVITNYDPDNEEARRLFKKAKTTLKELTKCRERIQKRQWRDTEEPLQKLLGDLAASHTSIRRELTIGLVQVTYHLNRDAEPIRKLIEDILEEDFDEPTFMVKAELLLKEKNFEEADRILTQVAKERYRGRVSGKLGELFQRAQQLLKKSKMKDYYKILGVTEDLDQASLKRAYRKLALQYHPDKVDENEKTEAEAKFAEVNEAYEVLSSPDKRRAWEKGEDPFKDEPEHPGFHFHPGAHSFRFHF